MGLILRLSKQKPALVRVRSAHLASLPGNTHNQPTGNVSPILRVLAQGAAASQPFGPHAQFGSNEQNLMWQLPSIGFSLRPAAQHGAAPACKGRRQGGSGPRLSVCASLRGRNPTRFSTHGQGLQLALQQLQRAAHQLEGVPGQSLWHWAGWERKSCRPAISQCGSTRRAVAITGFVAPGGPAHSVQHSGQRFARHLQKACPICWGAWH